MCIFGIFLYFFKYFLCQYLIKREATNVKKSTNAKELQYLYKISCKFGAISLRYLQLKRSQT